MPLPNFFVAGAPKSGTTALYDALVQHPDIFMPAIKEPAYFSFNGKAPEWKDSVAGRRVRRNGIWRPADYLHLFAGAGGCRAIGEATPDYLQAPVAARRIRDNIPQARIIAVLRHPAERAYSSYLYMIQKGIETAGTFSEALADEPRRIEQGWFSGLNHKTNGFYGQQLRVWFDLFPREQIKVYLYEEWRQGPQAMLRDLYGFLGVDPDFQPVLKQSNVTRVPRSRRLHNLALCLERAQGEWGRPAAALVQRLNRRYNLVKPPPLSLELRRALTEEYRADILLLQELIGRDLSHWLAPPTQKPGTV